MSHLCRISVSLIKKVRKKAKSKKMIPATPEPKIPENGPEPEFRPEFRRNFEPSNNSVVGCKYKYYEVLDLLQ
jgi:hypothetical protein